MDLSQVFPKKESIFKSQIIPIALSIIICAVLIVLLNLEIQFLNLFTAQDISLAVQPMDIAIGLTIYLKTAIDFAIYIGHLMDKNPGWKGRVAIEIGTAVGNAAGTMAILVIWAFFKEVRWLLVLMILVASLVLFKLAEDSLEHAQDEDKKYPHWFQKTVNVLEKVLAKINGFVSPLLKYVIPHMGAKAPSHLKFWPLFAASFTVPFVLGLDDFAGYVSLFTVVNVYGFGIGVFLGHMILNIFLYISPDATIRTVKNPIISLLGSLVFIGLGIWGILEIIKLIGH